MNLNTYQDEIQCLTASSVLLVPTIQPCLISHLNRRIILRKRPRQRLNTLNNPSKILPLLPRNLPTFTTRRLLIRITPLDFKRVEIDFGVGAEDIFRGIGGETAELADEGEEFGYIVSAVAISVRKGGSTEWLILCEGGSLTWAHHQSSHYSSRCRCSSSYGSRRGGWVRR